MTESDTRRHDWIFGYGSLIWRPAFPFELSRPGFIRGFERRFWQGSVDHRGTPEAPGRVVTLVRHGGALCWGMAFKIRTEDRRRVHEMLDHRESGGYRREGVEVEFRDGSTGMALTYRATSDNDNFLGPAPLHEMTEQIRSSSGPSGTNIDYVFKLAEALRTMQIYDKEVHALELRLNCSITDW
jgi:cation transport regulator ChaC